ncbi:excisionase family DNA-binding protein [Nonomuraea dietziae]|uniref:excisionase family DNA-binding protein n=1 Tax=Nonomuraea dietziae TaxID=65515 RepID=UPI0033C64CA9
MSPAAAREETYLKIVEVAARLRVSKMTVYRLVHDGELDPVLRVGRSFRVPASAVEAFLKGSVISR